MHISALEIQPIKKQLAFSGLCRRSQMCRHWSDTSKMQLRVVLTPRFTVRFQKGNVRAACSSAPEVVGEEQGSKGSRFSPILFLWMKKHMVIW